MEDTERINGDCTGDGSVGPHPVDVVLSYLMCHGVRPSTLPFEGTVVSLPPAESVSSL